MRQILTPSGELVADAPCDLETLKRLYWAMVESRTYDRKCTALQKQGRLATYAPFYGQEAAQVGSAAALRSDDWMVATYRDAAAMWMQGFGWDLLVLGRTGDERGGSPRASINVLPPSITVGAHMLHAVGLAWAERLQGSDRIAITYFGDGATSEGDFHEAMNFAAVFNTGTVFLCQNNGYAISMPRSEQTLSETIAGKADAYGMPGVLVDGNDVMAMYAATTEAVQRARSGEGPSLIEAVTYRLGPHTTNDDPHRYRTVAEEQSAIASDPIERLRLYLERRGAWDEDWQRRLEQKSTEALEAAVATAESLPAMSRSDVIEGMFQEPTATLIQQKGE